MHTINQICSSKTESNIRNLIRNLASPFVAFDSLLVPEFSRIITNYANEDDACMQNSFNPLTTQSKWNNRIQLILPYSVAWARTTRNWKIHRKTFSEETNLWTVQMFGIAAFNGISVFKWQTSMQKKNYLKKFGCGDISTAAADAGRVDCIEIPLPHCCIYA